VRTWHVLSIVACAIGLSACHSREPKRPAPQFTPAEVVRLGVQLATSDSNDFGRGEVDRVALAWARSLDDGRLPVPPAPTE
jgi:hypothetical protein